MKRPVAPQLGGPLMLASHRVFDFLLFTGVESVERMLAANSRSVHNPLAIHHARHRRCALLVDSIGSPAIAELGTIGSPLLAHVIDGPILTARNLYLPRFFPFVHRLTYAEVRANTNEHGYADGHPVSNQ